MRTESEKTQLKAFIIGLAVVAIVINMFFVSRENSARISKQREQEQQQEGQRQQQAEAERTKAERKAIEDIAAADLKAKADAAETARQAAQMRAERERLAAEKAAAEHAGFLARYVNPGFSRKPGMKAAAIAVESEDGKPNRVVSAALAGNFQNDTVEVVPSILKPEFVSDGLINDAFNDSSDLPRKLELAKSVDGLLLARETVEYSTNPALLNVITASLRLEVLLKPVTGKNPARIWTFTANGAGFNQSDGPGPCRRTYHQTNLRRQWHGVRSAFRVQPKTMI